MSKYNREDILRAGVQLLMTNGYSGLGIQHVLKTCGIPKGSFYNFFESKDAFVIETIEYYNAIVKNVLETIDQNTGLSSYKKIVAFFMSANDSFLVEGYHNTCPMLNTTADAVDNKELMKLIHDSFDMHKSFIEKWVTTAMSDGQVNKNYTASTLTHMIYDTYHGAILRMKYEQSSASLEQFIETVLPMYLL